MINFNFKASQLAIANEQIWHQVDSLGHSRAFYRALKVYLCSVGGYFSVVCRTSPFSGPYTSPKEYEFATMFPCYYFDIPTWLGTNVTYFKNGEEAVGTTQLLVFEAELCSELLESVDAVFNWAPPKPDDFAFFDAKLDLLGFSNRHEDELRIRSDILDSIGGE